MKCFSGKIFGPLRNPQPWFSGGRNFKFGQKSKIFNPGWVPKVLPHQKCFFSQILLIELDRKENILGLERTPRACNLLKCSEMRDFVIFGGTHFSPKSHLRVLLVSERAKILRKKLEMLGYIPKINLQKTPKTRRATKTSKTTFFFRSR